MGIFETIFKKPKLKNQMQKYFELLDGYTPVFTTYEGGVYEMELTRACIHAFASHCSKLLPTVTGADLLSLQRVLDGKPNPFMTSAQFLYKAATITETENTCYIVPLYNEYQEICGYYPISPQRTEFVEDDGKPYARYTFGSGKTAAIELDRVGIVCKYLYRKDMRGEDNEALYPTMQLISDQQKGISEGIKNGASYRFIAQSSNFARGKDLANERKRFTAENFATEDGGLLLFPNTYQNIQQIKSMPNIVNPEQMKIIETRVFDYFGCSEKILQNSAVGDDWSAYYEGKIEPWAIQLSQAMTTMTYSKYELARGNGIVWSANRLQYMTNSDKLQVSTQGFDRGFFSLNDVMDIWNLPHLENGDKRYIRKEYTELSKLGVEEGGSSNADGGTPVPGNDPNADNGGADPDKAD